MMRLSGKAVLAAVIIFVAGPFCIMLIAAMNSGDVLAFPPSGFSLRWFAAVLEVESFRSSFAVSLCIALAATLASLVLGIPVAYALSRYRVPGGELLRTLVTAPIIIPGIVVGLGLLRYFVIPLDLSVLLALFLAHTALLIPYAVRVVGASLENLRSDIEEAAILLGASRLEAFASIVLPNIRNGIVAAFVLGFITSFNHIPVSLFLTGPGVSTLPINMLSYMDVVYDPSIAALSSLLALVSIVVVFLAERLLGISRYV
jgi:putative spermidine/putrescine transport system permease protein